MSLVLIYFACHAFYGSRGIIAYFKVNKQLDKHLAELHYLKGHKIDIEHKNKLLRLESLDKDMLDEKAREVLDCASPTESVFSAK